MVTVYTKPNCVQCTQTKRYLDKLGVEYNTVDIFEDEQALEMIKEKGFLSAPVVHAQDVWWAGFQPDMLDSLA